MAARKDPKIWEFGDFQTPATLASDATTALRDSLSFQPKSIIEPTCGMGSFLLAAAEIFPSAERVIGVDINADYLRQLADQAATKQCQPRLEIVHEDFFQKDWAALLSELPAPILVLGNPPWVTNADIGFLKGANLPEKTNFQNHRGFDALTGKANFDISEWMLIQHLDWLKQKTGALAMLCKTSVARKLLLHAWKRGISTGDSRIIQIDAMQHFGASVNACFFVTEIGRQEASTTCKHYSSFAEAQPSNIFGYRDGLFLSDIPNYLVHQELGGIDKGRVWRSGVKHDCSKVMELKNGDPGYTNGSGEHIQIEDQFVFPLLKSSDLANGRVSDTRLSVIVTQTKVGEETNHIALKAPRTWRYLTENRHLLDARGSSIYKNKPRFSIFGIGSYAFAPWKVAISGFYKKLEFTPVGPINGKPTMFDDTVYFLSCNSEEEANLLAELLNSGEARAFLGSMIFWSDKRPITVDILKRLNIAKLARKLGREKEYLKLTLPQDSLSLFASGHLPQLETVG